MLRAQHEWELNSASKDTESGALANEESQQPQFVSECLVSRSKLNTFRATEAG